MDFIVHLPLKVYFVDCNLALLNVALWLCTCNSTVTLLWAVLRFNSSVIDLTEFLWRVGGDGSMQVLLYIRS